MQGRKDTCGRSFFNMYCPNTEVSFHSHKDKVVMLNKAERGFGLLAQAANPSDTRVVH